MPNYLFNIESKKVKFIKTKYRYIKTKIPASGTKQILNSLYKKESRSMHGQLPIVWKEAKDCFVKDIGGNQFIDFTSTIFVTNTGHSNKRVFNYMKREMSKNLISSYAYANEIREKYMLLCWVAQIIISLIKVIYINLVKLKLKKMIHIFLN